MKRRQFLGSVGASAAWIATVSRSLAAQGPTWQPDGAGTRARIGVLTPDFDPVPESEAWAMAPQGISIHASRVPWQPGASLLSAGRAQRFSDPPEVDMAVERLAETKPHAILYAFTSSSYTLDREATEALRVRLEVRAQGVPVVLAAEAASEALRTMNVRRIAVVHPPWFGAEANEKGRDYFRNSGFEVVSCAPMTPPRRFEEVSAAEVHDWVKSNVPRQAEGVLIAGNGLRAVGAIQALEASLSRPVLTANQVTFWQGLRAAGITASISDYGRLFKGAAQQ